MAGLDKVLRLAQDDTQPEVEPSRDVLRRLVQAAHDALGEACETPDPAVVAQLVYAAAGLVDSLAESLRVDELDDWVEATSAPDGTQVLLAGATAPYGNVPYADPGYIGGRKRYPIDPEHVKAAWSYINVAKNAARYTSAQLSAIKGKIKAAMKKHGHGANIDATAVSLAAGHSAGHAAMTGTHTHEHSHVASAHVAPSSKDSSSGPSAGLDSAASSTRRDSSGQSAAAASSRNMYASALSQLRDGEVCLAWPSKGKGDDKDDDKDSGPSDHFHTSHSGGKHHTHYTADGGHHDHEDDDHKQVDDHFSKYKAQFGKRKK